MGAVNTEALALVESWLREFCPETLDQKGVHLFAKLCELSVWTYKEKGVARCHPGRTFLAHFVNWSVTKVSRFTSKLRDFGVLRKYQPRTFDKDVQKWMPSTTIYTITFLGLAKIRQLAAVLKINLAHMTKPFSKNKIQTESCVRPPIDKAPIPTESRAQQVYQRVMAIGKRIAPEKEVYTSNIAINALLNRFAKLGQRTINRKIPETFS